MNSKNIGTTLVCSLKFLVIFLILLAGCQTPPIREISQSELEQGFSDYIAAYQKDLESISARTFDRIQMEYQRSLDSTETKPQSYDVLILSGGGAFGSFGIGFLEGWGTVENEVFSRPDFDSVSGISTGALIAPFAFLGTEKAYSQILDLYKNPQRNWVRKRGIIPYLPGNVSIFDVSDLHKKIRSVITPDLINDIAKKANENRLLLIGATNLDYGFSRVWDVAQLAIESSTEEALKLSTSLLLASTAIPGAFPPILIDDNMYVDGGATMQFVTGLDERSWVYSRDPVSFHFVKKNKPINIRVWIVINQKLLPDKKVVGTRWTAVAQRSLGTLIRSSTLQSLQDMETYVQLIDQYSEINAEMRYVAIPQDFSVPDSDEMFDTYTMRKLLALGQEMGRKPTSWKSRALRPGAPF